MKTYLLAAFLIITTVFTACSKKSGEEQVGEPVTSDELAILKKEVMEVHDEVMPKMDDMYSLKTSLKKKLETLAADSAARSAVEGAIQKLDSAHDGMMVWMRQYQPDVDSLNVERAREYYENQMEKVKKVKQDILSALERGERLK